MKRTAPLNSSRADTNHTQIHPITTAAQRQRLLDRLKKGPISTLTARLELDVLHPAARIQELRKKGYHIITQWQYEETRRNQKHRVAKYILLPGELTGGNHGR